VPKLKARRFLSSLTGFVCALSVAAAFAADPAKVLRIAMPDVETLDPQQYNDNPSFEVQCAIYEGMYEWDYFASPARLAPDTAVALPEITEGGKVWTIKLKRGIYFSDDPAFRGSRRELVAQDYVYSLKRWLDPTLRRGGAPLTSNLIVGMKALVDAATKPGGRFDYDTPVEGLRALDRNTVQLRLTEANYPLINTLMTVGAAAREVVEAANGDARNRAVGTGPYRVKEWLKGSRIVLEARPDYRRLSFPRSDLPAHRALMRAMADKTFPRIGVIEINFITEEITHVLEFDRGKLDYLVLRSEVANRLLDRGKLKPELAARGITHQGTPEPVLFMIFLNMEDPVIGGMSKERIALRRAMAYALDTGEIARVVYGGHALPASQMVAPGVSGYDPAASLPPAYDPAMAQKLLDRFGYGQRDSAGYRLAPDGKPLSITFTIRSGGISRELQTLARKNMDAVGLRMEFRVTPFQEAVKELVAGQYQLFYAGRGGIPSGWGQLQVLSSKSPPAANASRFFLPECDLAS
jgi:ABC-type transport system substrate-binding protein